MATERMVHQSQPVERSRLRVLDGRMSDLELAHTASAFNNELTAALVVLMSDRSFYTTAGLVATLHRLQKGSDQRQLSSQLVEKHIDKLVSFGMVDRVGVGRGAGRILTEYGQARSAAAGWLLDFSDRHELSLSDVNGGTRSPLAGPPALLTTPDGEIEVTHRPSLDRIRIYQHIYDAEKQGSLPIPIEDVVNQFTNERKNPVKNADWYLRHLNESSIISFVFLDGRFSRYTYVPNTDAHPERNGRYHGDLDNPLLAYIRQHPGSVITPADGIAIIRAQMPEKAKDMPDDRLYTYVTVALSELARQGFLERQASHITLTNEQPSQLEDILKTFQNLGSRDLRLRTEGEMLGRGILADSEKLARLLNKARRRQTDVKR
jgi:hypothetical protein